MFAGKQGDVDKWTDIAHVTTLGMLFFSFIHSNYYIFTSFVLLGRMLKLFLKHLKE